MQKRASGRVGETAGVFRATGLRFPRAFAPSRSFIRSVRHPPGRIDSLSLEESAQSSQSSSEKNGQKIGVKRVNREGNDAVAVDRSDPTRLKRLAERREPEGGTAQ